MKVQQKERSFTRRGIRKWCLDDRSCSMWFLFYVTLYCFAGIYSSCTSCTHLFNVDGGGRGWQCRAVTGTIFVTKLQRMGCFFLLLYIILVGGLVAIFYFPIHIGFLIIPIDVHIFQRGGPTTNQYKYIDLWITLGTTCTECSFNPLEISQKSCPNMYPYTTTSIHAHVKI